MHRIACGRCPGVYPEGERPRLIKEKKKQEIACIPQG